MQTRRMAQLKSSESILCTICLEIKQNILKCKNNHYICLICYERLTYITRFNTPKKCPTCRIEYDIFRVEKTKGIGNILNTENIFRYLDKLNFEEISKKCYIPPKYIYKLIYELIKLIKTPYNIEFPECIIDFFICMDPPNEKQWIKNLCSSVRNLVNRIINKIPQHTFTVNSYEDFALAYLIGYGILSENDEILKNNSTIYSKLSCKFKFEDDEEESGEIYDENIEECLECKREDDDISILFEINADMSQEDWDEFMKEYDMKGMIYLHPSDWNLKFGQPSI